MHNADNLDVKPDIPSNNIVEFSSEGRFVKADTDNGYLRVANDLVDAVCRVEMSGRQHRVFLAIIRKTYGWGKKTDFICASQIAQLIGCEHDTNVRADIRELKGRNLLLQRGANIGPNPVISEWVYDRRKAQGRIENDPDRKQSGADRKQSGGRIENDPQSGLKTIRTKDNKDNIKTIGGADESAPQKRHDSETQKTKKRATQIDPQFAITDDMRIWSKEKQIRVNLELETEKFVNYWLGNGKSKINWVATWKNWVLRAMEFAASRGQVATQQPTRRELPLHQADTSKPRQPVSAEARRAARIAAGLEHE